MPTTSQPKLTPSASRRVSLFGGPVQAWITDDKDNAYLVASKPHNAILDAAYEAAVATLSGRSEYRVSHMYIEFEKSSGSLTPPAIDSDDQAYYTDLKANASADTDYLRVPLNEAPTYSGSVSPFTANVVAFSAQTGITIGEREQASPGDGFTLSTGDRVVGGALVCCPTGDKNDDILFARFYYDPSDFVTKIDSNHQILIVWKIQLAP